MKKAFLILITLLIFSPQSYGETENIALLTKKGFFEKQETTQTNPYEEIKKTMAVHLKASNAYDINKLSSLYADKYINGDGFKKDVYFDLIEKTWASYKDIKYKMEIKNIQVYGDLAMVELNEYAIATTDSKSSALMGKGLLRSISDCIYYFEKINNDWQITSDHTAFEKIYLSYGAAQNSQIELIAPSQILANTPYTASLEIKAPQDTLVIASIGREIITYPQTVADEVFRKFPDNNCLERMFTSNDKNINEYTVASYGMTKAEIKKGSEIKIYITGLGFVMSRVNVIPINNYIKYEPKTAAASKVSAEVKPEVKTECDTKTKTKDKEDAKK